MKTALLAAALLLAVPAFAQDSPAKGDKPPNAEDAAILPPQRSVTRHNGSFGGTKVSYTATTGETYLKDKDGKPTAPTCGSAPAASTRNCCATAAPASAGSTRATSGSTKTPRGRSPTTPRASKGLTPAIPPR